MKLIGFLVSLIITSHAYAAPKSIAIQVKSNYHTDTKSLQDFAKRICEMVDDVIRQNAKYKQILCVDGPALVAKR